MFNRLVSGAGKAAVKRASAPLNATRAQGVAIAAGAQRISGQNKASRNGPQARTMATHATNPSGSRGRKMPGTPTPTEPAGEIPATLTIKVRSISRSIWDIL